MPPLTEALGSLRVSGSPEPSEPAKGTKRKRESDAQNLPATSKGRSNVAGTPKNAVPGPSKSSVGKPTHTKKAEPAASKYDKLKSTGKINIPGCGICIKRQIKCKVRQGVHKIKEGKIPACVGCSKNNKRCQYPSEQTIEDDPNPTDTEETGANEETTPSHTEKGKGKARNDDEPADEAPAPKKRKVRPSVKSSKYVLDEDTRIVVDNASGKVRRNERTAVNANVPTGPPKGPRLGMVPVIIQQKANTKPASSSKPKAAPPASVHKPESALPKPTVAPNPTSGSKTSSYVASPRAGPSNSTSQPAGPVETIAEKKVPRHGKHKFV